MSGSSTPRMRRLAAVWFADVAGYTRLSAENETAALSVVDSLQTAAATSVAEFAGRVVKCAGDSVLAEFGSTEAAVRAALLLQRAFAEQCGRCGVPALLRIAVHVGDVVTAADGDILGDGVNRASRLQTLARPGTVLVSEDVWRQVRPRRDFHFFPVRPQRAQGTDEPVRAYLVNAPAALQQSAADRGERWWHVALAALIVTACMAGQLLALVFLGPGPLDRDLVLVAPFYVATPDHELQQWQEDLVVILSHNLDGAGNLRAVPASVAIRAWHGYADRAAAHEIGRRLGAGLVVFGELLAHGPESARLSAAIFDVVNERVLGEVVLTVREPAHRIGHATDSLTVALLRSLGQHRARGDVRFASLGSLTSVPALKAFLRGEQFYRRTAWDSAIAYYERALAADSTFALPLRRIGVALTWRTAAMDERANSFRLRAGALNHGYAPRDSLLLLADSLAAAAFFALNDPHVTAPEYWRHVRRLFATLADAAARYPDDPETWYALGDARYHFGTGPAAVAEQRVRAAFDSAIALDSSFAPAYIHPIELGFRRGGRALGLRYAQSYLSLQPTDGNAAGVRLAARLATAPRLEPELLDDVPSDHVLAALFLLDAWPDSAQTATWLAQQLLRRHTGDTLVTCVTPQPALARQLARSGRLREARCAAADRARIAAEAALLGAVPPDSSRPFLEHWLSTTNTGLAFMAPWLLALGDTAALHDLLLRADSAVRQRNAMIARQLASYDTASIRAHLALARGDTADALRRFRALPDTLCSTCGQLDRLTLGRLLAALGQTDPAEQIFSEWRGENMYPSDVAAALERARAAERRGRRDVALAAFRHVADAWAHADAALGPQVAEARAGVLRLERARAAAPRPPAR